MSNPRQTPSLLSLILVFVVLLTVATVLVCFLWFHQTRSRAETMLAQIEAKGEPSDPHSLAKSYYELNEASDLTAEWQRLLNIISGIDFGNGKGGSLTMAPPGRPWADQTKVERSIESHASLRDRIHELTKKPGLVRFPVDFSAGTMALLEHLNPVRKVGRFLSFEAYLHAHAGDEFKFTESVEAMLATADTLKDEPLLVSMLVRCAIRSVAIESVQDSLSRINLSKESLRRIRSRLQQEDPNHGLQIALMGERAMMSNCFEHPELLSEEGSAMSITPMRYADMCFYLDSMNKMVDSSRQSWPDAWHEIQRIDAELAAQVDNSSYLKRFQHMLSGLLLPALSSTFRASGRSAFLTDACVVATAIEEYRIDHRELPDELVQLAPDYIPQVPIDVFDGQAIRYRKTTDGYLLYSVGADGIDDGGTMTEQSYQPDIVFQVPRPLAVDQDE